MITSIFNWLCECLSNALDTFITMFLSALDLDMSSFISAFPLFYQVYHVLQDVAVGLTVVIAIVSFYQFFFTNAIDGKGMQEHPAAIIFKSFVAAGLIYFGGYLLSIITDIAKLSFDTFNSLATETASGGELAVDLFTSLFSAETLMGLLGAGTSLKSGGASLLSLVMMLTIAWELIKLVIEVAERYLIVAVLVYTSPIIYPTLASKRTESIFRKWVSMFISSCILMSFSVIFLKVIVNGLTEVTIEGSGATYLMQLILVLAMCKIAQRVDTYMQSLGLSVATTGGSLLDDVVAVTSGLRSLSQGVSNMVQGKGLAGKVFSMTPPGMALNAARGAVNAAAAGGTKGEIKSAAMTGSLKGIPLVGRYVGAQEGKAAGAAKAEILGQTGEQAAATARAEMAKGFKEPLAYNAADTLHGKEMQQAQRMQAADEKATLREAEQAQRRQEMDEKSAERDFTQAQTDVERRTAAPALEGQPVTDSIKGKVNSSLPFSDSEAQSNFDTFGATEKGYGAFRLDENGSIVPDYNFAAAGGSCELDNNGNEILVSKNQAVVGDAIRNGDTGRVRRDLYDPQGKLAAYKTDFDSGDYLVKAKADHAHDKPLDAVPEYKSVSSEIQAENSSYAKNRDNLTKQLANSAPEDQAAVQSSIDTLDKNHEDKLAGLEAKRQQIQSAYADNYSAINKTMADVENAFATEMEDLRGQMNACTTADERAVVSDKMDTARSRYKDTVESIDSRKEALDNICESQANNAYDADRSKIYNKLNDASESAREIAMNTARTNPAASTEAFFGRAVPQSYTDDYGQAIMAGAFGHTIARDGSDCFRQIRVQATPNGNELSFFDTSTNQTYLVIEKAGYLKRSDSERSRFFDITCADGVTRYTTAPFSGTERIFKSRKR